MSNLSIYITGFLILILGLAWGAHTLGAPPLWIGIFAVIFAGAGIVSGVSRTRLRESSPEDGSKQVVIADGD